MKRNNFPFKSVLITGASGFIGSHLINRLSKEKIRISVIVRPSTDQSLLINKFPSIKVYVYDGSTGSLDKILKQARPEAVFHLASMFLATHSPADIASLIESNILFGTQLLEAMIANQCHNLINTGTSWQHFQNGSYCPVNLYAATKQAFDDIVAYYVSSTCLKVITLKLFDTYGAGDRRHKLFKILRDASLSSRMIKMSPGRQMIDLVNIDDVIDAYLLAARRIARSTGKNNECFAVSSGKLLELKEIVKIYSRLANRKINVFWGGVPYRKREVMSPWNNGKRLPGWKPKIGLLEGIRRLLAKETNA